MNKVVALRFYENHYYQTKYSKNSSNKSKLSEHVIFLELNTKTMLYTIVSIVILFYLTSKSKLVIFFHFL